MISGVDVKKSLTRSTNVNIRALLRGRTINRTCRIHRLRYWGHIVRRPHNHILKKALNYRATGKLKRGRPCFTWNTSLQHDIRLSRIDDDDWARTINDTSLHNAKCNSLYDRQDTDDSDSDWWFSICCNQVFLVMIFADIITLFTSIKHLIQPCVHFFFSRLHEKCRIIC